MLTGTAGPDSQGLIGKPLPLHPVSPGKGYHIPQGGSLRFPSIPQHLLGDTKQARPGESTLTRGAFPPTHPPPPVSQGICLEVSSVHAPLGWSYLLASKIDKECSEIFVKTQNQLDLPQTISRSYQQFGVSVFMPKWALGRRKNFEIFFSKAKTQKSKNRNNHLSFR